MQFTKAVVEQLAEAWMAEVKRLRPRAMCDCGCGGHIPVTQFKPGHDAKLKSDYSKKIRAILAS